LRENLWLTVRSIAEQVNIDIETVMKVLTKDLDMRMMCTKMVSKDLAEAQKQKMSHNLPRPFGDAR
jgi:energy-converting hydrogenase A subunit M